MCLGTSCSVFSEGYLFALETPLFIFLNHKGLVESLHRPHRKLKRLLGHFSEATITQNYATGGMSEIRTWLTDLRPYLRPWTPHEVRRDTAASGMPTYQLAFDQLFYGTDKVGSSGYFSGSLPGC